MSRFTDRVGKKAGLSPATLVHVGEKKMEQVRLRVFDYDEEAFEERELKDAEECFPYRDKPSVTWINVDGLHREDVVEKIGEHFGLHPLILEDILHTGHRPKLEEFEDHLIIILKMLVYDDERHQVHAEQFSVAVGKNYVISFQERAGDVFDPIRERLRKGKGRLRSRGADYLAYALIDTIVDNYFVILEKIGEYLESLEEDLITDPVVETLQRIHHLRRELILLRRSVWPLRDVISLLERGESDLFEDKTAPFLRDLYDHTIQVIDTVETFRDMVSGMVDVYLSGVSNKMNEVMKVLTIIATIFMPMTFIAGIYGMNFKYMPELEWPWGYPLVWLLVTVLGVFMLLYFRKKRWI